MGISGGINWELHEIVIKISNVVQIAYYKPLMFSYVFINCVICFVQFTYTLLTFLPLLFGFFHFWTEETLNYTFLRFLPLTIEAVRPTKKDPCFSLARASIFQVQVKRIEAGVKIRVELFNYWALKLIPVRLGWNVFVLLYIVIQSERKKMLNSVKTQSHGWKK